MTITYLDTFHLIGVSTDTKPSPAAIGCLFFEIDTQKHFIFDGSWKDVKGGTGVWSPNSAETLTNKRMVINQNDFETSSGANGLFGFHNAEFNFVPIGSAGLFLKVSATGDSFEFADPAVSGAWNPNATEEITNKTINSQLNTIKQTTPAAGSLLLDNGTKFLPLAKGANGNVLMVDENGNVVWGTVQGGQGGNNYYNALPSQSDQLWGWWHPLSVTSGGHGILKDNFTIGANGTTNTVVNHATRGRYLKMTMNATGDDAGFRTPTLLWRREYDSYLKCKFRVSVATTYSQWIGFASNMSAQFDSSSELDSQDGFCFARMETDNNWRFISNDGSSNQTEHSVYLKTRDTLNHTVEIISDSANNRFGYRIDDESGAWAYINTNLPRSGIDLGIIANLGAETSSTFDYELYLIETYNKLLV